MFQPFLRFWYELGALRKRGAQLRQVSTLLEILGYATPAKVMRLAVREFQPFLRFWL
jgi:hypothetical protein